MRYRIAAFLLTPLLAALAADSGQAQSISTGTTSNNGTGGIFLSLTPFTQNLQMTAFSTQFAGTVGSTVNVEVWTRPGAYAGFTASNVGWTLTQTLSGFANGTTTNSALITLTTPIDVPVGATTSVYLHSTTAGGGIRYFGTGTTSTSTYTNADVTLFSDISRTGAVAFGGTQFTPRAFVGEIVYQFTPVPEPGSIMLVASVIGAGGVWWRRKRGGEAC